MKRVLILFCIFLFIFSSLLTGCAKSIDNVKLDTESSMLKYCKKTFGDCEIINYFTSGSHMITYNIRDKEKDFTYQVTSYATEVGLDVALYYTKARTSDFNDRYYDAFIEEYKDNITEIESKYNTTVNYDDTYLAMDLYGQDIDSLKNVAKRLIEFKKIFDTRNILKDFKVYLYICEEYVGYIDETLEYFSIEQIKINDLLNRAAHEMKVSVDELTYIRSETIDCKLIIGYNETIDKEEKTETIIYYFNYNNEEYYVADLLYYNEQGSHPFGNYPHN